MRFYSDGGGGETVVMRLTLVIPVLLLAGTLGPVREAHGAVGRPESRSAIDGFVFARLDHLGIPPSDVCSDAVFVRRVYLDMTGTLPTAREVREFLDDTDTAKRSLLIERLFDHTAFADYWTQKWCDLLRVKAEFPSKHAVRPVRPLAADVQRQ